jgi:Alanine-zipper, major outer membrane lipoprotein
MRRGVVVWMGCAMLLATVAVAGARGERDLTDEELRAEMAENRALAAYVARNGEPDVAETHFLADKPPWDDHEVTIYYLEMRKEIGFARAWILGRPEVQIARYERPLTDEKIAALSSRARRPKSDVSGLGPDARAEEAARRAELAAGKVEAAADSAERAADSAEAVANKMESGFHRSLRK